MPVQPLISDVDGPREVLAGQDATFSATVLPGLAGTVTFALKTYAGVTVWAIEAPIEDGTASVSLSASEATKLTKGERVLIVTANDRADRSAYAPVRLRGRIFRDAIQAPAELAPGDEIVITDMSLLGPQDALSARSEKGKWWLRRYTAPGEASEGTLAAVEEADPYDPDSCLASELRLPLDLDGWYEVWVRTHRPPVGGGAQGGVDVRLSGERCFRHADPTEVAAPRDAPDETDGALVDIFYRAADLTGQDLLFQQPYGTYSSDTKLSTASLAGVRLVKLSEEQVAEVQAERRREAAHIIGYDNDGFSYFWKWGVHHPDCIARLIEPLRDQSAAFLNVELGGLGGITIPTPYTGMYQMGAGYVRDGDMRANAFFQWCYDNDVNILDTLTEYGHQVGVKVFASLMMERSFSRDETMRAHPEWRITKGRGNWNYALPEVQDYQIKKIAWIIGNHDIDGFIVDFTRYGHFFNEDEPNKFEHMNAFLRKLSAAVDEVNAGKERKVLLCASYGDRSWHLTHWGTGVLSDQGLDVDTWLKEELFDIIMPEGFGIGDLLAEHAGSRTRIWPRKVCNVSLRTHTYDRTPLSPGRIQEEVKWAMDSGAPGIFFFNHESSGTFRRLGSTEETELRSRVDAPYGYREGAPIRFATWYPNAGERGDQRATFKPLTIAPDAQGKVDADLAVPIRNTFEHAVEATVRLDFVTLDAGAQWTIEPATRSVTIASGDRAEAKFRLSGTAVTHHEAPVARIDLSSEGQTVLRQRVPVRIVPQMQCRRVEVAPVIDGDLTDAAWAGLQACTLYPEGDDNEAPWQSKMAFAHDDANLYVAYECAGMDVSRVATEPAERDAREILRGDHLELLLDTKGHEQAYLAFAVTPAGGQGDYRAHYESFTGQFQRKTDWNGDWSAKTVLREDGYAVELAVPFATLGATPRPGDVWRMNLLLRSLDDQGKAAVVSWASYEEAFHLPRHEGTLHGTLVF